MRILSRKFVIDGRQGCVETDIYGDTHLGSRSVDESLLKEHIQETRDTGRWWGFVGDGIEGIVPDDKRRFNTENITDWSWIAYKNRRLIQAQYEYWADMFAPIADKCLFYVCGDGKHSRHENIADCRSDMCAKMGIPGPYQMVYYNYNIQRDTASRSGGRIEPIVFHHGYFAGRMAGSKVNNLVRCLNYFPQARAFFCGHGHTKVKTDPQVGIIACGSKVRSIERRAAMTGSYLKTYSDQTVGYGEVKLFPPVALGRITFKLSPFHPKEDKQLVVFND